MGTAENVCHPMGPEDAGTRGFQYGTQGQTAAEQYQYTPIGGFFYLFPTNQAKSCQQNYCRKRDYGVKLADTTERLW